MLIIGLTGLIGSGKTLVGEIFASHKVDIIDTDKIAHELVRPGSDTLYELTQEFGECILDSHKMLDRKKMLGMMLDDTVVLNKLEQILHPKIYLEAIKQINSIQHAQYIIVIVPLLFRSKQFCDLIDRSLFIDCTRAHLKHRLTTARNFTTKQIDKILRLQPKRCIQRTLCDDVLTNNDSKESLVGRVNRLHHKYTKLAHVVNT